MLVLSVLDGSGAMETVLLEETHGTGVTAEGVGVQGPVLLALQEEPQGSAADTAPPVRAP
jgi:hypothetical protein